MKLKDFIVKNFKRNNKFAARYGYTDQQVSLMLKKGSYYVYDNKVFNLSKDLEGM